jgi:hypothetical protein
MVVPTVLPTINLGASGGFESSAITTLINGPSGLWSIGLSAVGTVFDVGRRRALTDQARAAYDYQVASYRENVLTGFQQVEDNLVAVRILEHEAHAASCFNCRRADPAVSFLCPSQLDAVRFRQLFQRFSKAVHPGLLIVKLLCRPQLITLQPNREP